MVANLDREERQPVTAPTQKAGFRLRLTALCFVSSSVLAESLVLRIRQLLVAAKRYIFKESNL